MKKLKPPVDPKKYFKLNEQDVRIAELLPPVCDMCDRRAEVAVALDFRGAGFSHTVGKYCQACAKNIQERIRTGLR